MLITKRNDYALQAMIHLARLGKNAGTSAGLLAATLGTSPALMAKICQSLAHAGLVKARRGRGGGLSLARPAQRITTRDVFRAVDGELVISECMSRGPCKQRHCALYPTLTVLQRELNRDLNNTTLAGLARQKQK